MQVTHKEITYSTPVFVGIALDVVAVEDCVDFCELEVLVVVSIVVGLIDFVDDETLVELGFAVSYPGRH